MAARNVAAKFERMGARLKVGELAPRWGRPAPERFTLDVGSDRRGGFFELLVRPGEAPEISVADVRRDDRHLLLLIREPSDSPSGETLHKFLCGHDERSWFVAALPERCAASNVAQAKEALKPRAAVASQASRRVKAKRRNKRRNPGFVRQGEWFFIPRPGTIVDDALVLRDEPLVRGRGKPHFAEFLYRSGGETVYVSSAAPGGLSAKMYAELLRRDPEKRNLNWRPMQREAEVLVKGAVRHPDHKTIRLAFWHVVVPNTEDRSASRRNLTFLD